MASGHSIITVVNMTNFFNRELFMYALGDIKFKKPIALKKVAYTLGFLIIWCIPFYMLFGLQFNPFFMAFFLVPPLALGHYGSKPVFGGKGLIDFLKTTFKFIGEPKIWTDMIPAGNKHKVDYYVDSQMWISRRREIYKLKEMRENG